MANLRWQGFQSTKATAFYARSIMLPGFLVSLFVSGCAPSSIIDEDCSQKRSNKIDIIGENGLLYNNIAIKDDSKSKNGLNEGPVLRVLIDTGWSDNTISREVAKSLKLNTNENTTLSLTPTGGYNMRSLQYSIGSMLFGSITYTAQFSVMDVTSQIDGVLGAQTLFYNDVFEFSASKRQMTLYYPRSCWLSMLSEKTMHEIEVKHVSNDPSSVALFPVKVENVSTYGIFDTGAQYSVMTNVLARNIGISDINLSQDKMETYNDYNGRSVVARRHHFKQIVLGSVIISDIDVGIGDFTLPNDTQMVLGLDIWRRFNVRYDPIGSKALLYINEPRN